MARHGIAVAIALALASVACASAPPEPGRDAPERLATPDEVTGATWRVRLIDLAPPRLAVTANLPVDGRELRMDPTRPANTGELANGGWPALVSRLRVADEAGRALEITSAGDAGWLLTEARSGRLTLNYEVDFTTLAAHGWPAPRESGLAASDHIVLHSRSLFVTTEATGPSAVSFVLPPGWQPVTAWEPRADGAHEFHVENSGDLVGNLLVFTRTEPEEIRAGGMRLLVAGMGHWQAAGAEVRRVLGAVVPRVADLMGEGAHGGYLVVLLPNPEQGAESFPRSLALTMGVPPDRSNSAVWGNLIAHEVTHRWNGWGLKGADYASSQWFQEGFTEYAANVAMVSAGLIGPEEFLGQLSVHVRNARRLQTTLAAPGTHKGPPLYSGGALVAFLWDVAIRDATQGRRDLWSFLATLWEQTGGGQRRYAWPDLRAALASTADLDWDAFHRAHIEGSTPLPLAGTLPVAGLRLTEASDGSPRVEVAPDAGDAPRALWRALTQPR